MARNRAMENEALQQMLGRPHLSEWKPWPSLDKAMTTFSDSLQAIGDTMTIRDMALLLALFPEPAAEVKQATTPVKVANGGNGANTGPAIAATVRG
jgi:hypothetical protein